MHKRKMKVVAPWRRVRSLPLLSLLLLSTVDSLGPIELLGYELDFFGAIFRIAFRNSDQCLFNNFYNERTFEDGDLPRRKDYRQFRVEPAEVKNTMPVQDQGPASTHGILWAKQQWPISEIISFAESQEGAGLSSGVLSSTAPAYRIRQLGDKTWLAKGFPPFLSTLFDIIVEVSILEGTPANPTKFRFGLDVLIPGTCIRYRTKDCPELDWTMALTNTPDPADAFPTHEKYATSNVWLRESRGVVGFDYNVIQIIGGDGAELQPAYQEFLDSRPLPYNVFELNPDTQPPRCDADVEWWCFFLCPYLPI